MSKRIKIGDTVSFRFAGSNLEGTVIVFYMKGGVRKATIQSNDEKKRRYPTNVESLTKL